MANYDLCDNDNTISVHFIHTFLYSVGGSFI